MAHNVAEFSGYGLKGVRITPTLIISFPILWLLSNRSLLVWSNVIGLTSIAESYNVLEVA